MLSLPRKGKTIWDIQIICRKRNNTNVVSTINESICENEIDDDSFIHIKKQ